eukprot:365942-Chlamydomonas_euryale.AAC.25
MGNHPAACQTLFSVPRAFSNEVLIQPKGFVKRVRRVVTTKCDDVKLSPKRLQLSSTLACSLWPAHIQLFRISHVACMSIKLLDHEKVMTGLRGGFELQMSAGFNNLVMRRNTLHCKPAHQIVGEWFSTGAASAYNTYSLGSS